MIVILKNLFSNLKPNYHQRLFTWGFMNEVPTQVLVPQNIQKIYCGPYHSAIISTSGNLYTYGYGRYGQLGHGNFDNVFQPQLVEYFAKNNISIKDVVCGQRHTVALTQQGKVYTFGWGGKNQFLQLLLIYGVGALGQPNNQHLCIPKQIMSFQREILNITGGRYFNIVLDIKKKIYHFGRKNHFVFGDALTHVQQPEIFYQLMDFIKNNKRTLLKIQSCGNSTMVLLSDGRLYGWGGNKYGQIGSDRYTNPVREDYAKEISKTITQGYEGKKVLNMNISEDTTVFQLENGEIWSSGIVYRTPSKIQIGEKVRLYTAGRASMAIVSSNNNIYSKKYLPIKNATKEGMFDVVRGEEIFGGEIINIGGGYFQKYVIVNDY